MQLEETPLFEKGQFLFNNIDTHLAEIQDTQRKSKSAPSPEEHISVYRDNIEKLKKVDLFLDKLKKLILPGATGEELGLTVTGAGKGAGAGGEGEGVGEGAPPSLGLTAGSAWKLMLVIISFLGLLSVIFFLIWQQQLKKSRVVPELKLPELEEGSEEGEAGPGTGPTTT